MRVNCWRKLFLVLRRRFDQWYHFWRPYFKQLLTLPTICIAGVGYEKKVLSKPEKILPSVHRKKLPSESEKILHSELRKKVIDICTAYFGQFNRKRFAAYLTVADRLLQSSVKKHTVANCRRWCVFYVFMVCHLP